MAGVLAAVMPGLQLGRAQQCDVQIVVESPAEGATVDIGEIDVRGWANDFLATDSNGVDSVRVGLDIDPTQGGPTIDVTFREDRPDLDLRPSQRNAAGFLFVWNAVAAGPGGHTLYVQVHSRCGWATAARSVTVTTGMRDSVPAASTPARRASLTHRPSAAVAGGSLTVTWSDVPSPCSDDWVALYPDRNTADTSFVTYQSTGGGRDGSALLPIPLSAPPGNSYELRLFSCSGYTQLAATSPLTVLAPTNTPVPATPTRTPVPPTATPQPSATPRPTAIPTATPSLPAPGIVSVAINPFLGTVTLSWRAPTATVAGYIVMINESDSSQQPLQQVPGSQTSATFQLPDPRIAYSLSVVGVDSFGNRGAASQPVFTINAPSVTPFPTPSFRR